MSNQGGAIRQSYSQAEFQAPAKYVMIRKDDARFAACFTAINEQGGMHLYTDKSGGKPCAIPSHSKVVIIYHEKKS
jgi:hypothetical protein